MKKTPRKLLEGQRCTREVRDDDGNVLVRKDRKFTKSAVRKLGEAGIEWIQVGADDLIRTDAVKRVAPVDIVDESTGEVILESNEELTEEHLDEIRARGIEEFELLFLDPLTSGTALRDTLLQDKTLTKDEAVMEIYRRLRPGIRPLSIPRPTSFRTSSSTPTGTTCPGSADSRSTTSSVFLRTSAQNCNCRANREGTLEVPLAELPTLRKDDILEAVRYLVELKNGSDASKRVDDIDHLGNRRVRVVGELLENQYRIGLVRMERAIKERMSLQEIETLMPTISSTRSRSRPSSRSSSVRASFRSSWIRRTRFPR